MNEIEKRRIEDRMLEDAKVYIRATGDFRTPPEIAEVFGGDALDWQRKLQKWKTEGAIFSIEDQGIERFPLYALDPNSEYRPYKAVGEVLGVLRQALSNFGIAAWFAGLNSFLDGQYPKDLLDVDPNWVIEAAQDEVNGIDFG